MAADPEGPAEPERGGIWGRAYDGLGHVGGIILAVMTAAVFIQVVLRFLGRTGIDGLEEVPRYLFVWLIMIGAAAAMQRGEHTVLDFFINLLGPRSRALVIAFTTVVGIALFVYLIKLSFVLVPNAQLQTSAGLELPLGYVFAAIPVGAVLIILPMLRQLVAAVRSLWQKRS
ncbi:TRAP transporter small permease [Desertibaculum subflavum]|uniref:TRAP transporter small permease n=1 Tax=Desertibaculum subflavum TaxID=2268458 RepID=UPI000E66C4C3